MSNKTELLKQALFALESITETNRFVDAAIDDIGAELSRPEYEATGDLDTLQDLLACIEALEPSKALAQELVLRAYSLGKAQDRDRATSIKS